MIHAMNFTMTDSAIAKILELMAEEGSPTLKLRILSNQEQGWGLTFEDVARNDDLQLEIGGMTVLLRKNLVDLLRDAKVDFDPETGFKVGCAKSPEENSCNHLSQLPEMPDSTQLKAMRRGLRKRKPPEIASFTRGGHVQIGRFEFDHTGDTPVVRWTLLNMSEKCATFDQLCMNPDHEWDRLKLGWMIANMAKLDEIHELESVNNDIPDPRHSMMAISRIIGYFSEIENRWRHWAIVPAGHMLIKTK